MCVFVCVCVCVCVYYTLSVSVSFVVQQQLHHLLVSGAGAVQQGRPTTCILSLELRPSLQQQEEERNFQTPQGPPATASHYFNSSS